MGFVSQLLPGAATEPDAADVTVDELLEALANERRRYILRHVASYGEPVDKRTLADLVAAEECDYVVRPTDVSSTERKSTYVSLHQVHLPALDDVGLVDYDRNMVTTTPATDAALSLLDHAEDVTGGDA